MKKNTVTNFIKGLSILIFVSLLLYLVWDRNRIYEKYNHNFNSLTFCKDYSEYSLNELEQQAKIIGKQFNYEKVRQINNIKIDSSLKKMIFFADGASCKPCYKAVIDVYLNMLGNNKSQANTILMVGSRNYNFAKSITREFKERIPILVDKDFQIKRLFKIDEAFTTGFLLDENNECIAFYVFRSSDDYLNNKKLNILSNLI